MRKSFVLSILLLAGPGLFAQQVVSTLTVSNPFSTTAGTPRVVRNGFQHVWLVAWRQQGGPSKIMGRIVKSDGSMLPAKVLASSVSAADQNFDISYDSDDYTYLVAYENAAGLQVQLFNGSLIKQGTASLIEGGVSGVLPRLAYDPVGKKFLIFWLSTSGGVPKQVLKSRALDVHGKPTADAKTLATAAAGKTYFSLSVSTNQKNGNLTALIDQQTSSSGDLIGYLVKPDGTLAKTAPTLFQPATPGLRTAADASFTDAGTGLGFWTDHTNVKFRKLTLTGGFASPTKSLAGFADINSVQASVLWDIRNNQFIGAWSLANTVRAVVINTTSATVTTQPFSVGSTSLTHCRDVATSFDAQLGNAIAVWEDSTVDGSIASQPGASFKIRAAIFFVSGPGSTDGVSIGDNFFSPASLTITQGSTVVWTNNGNSSHTVTSGTPSSSPGTIFDSPNMTHGQTFSFRFTEAGTFSYFCRVHGSSMAGTITVTAAGGEPSPHY
jgi:plastocyanin